MVNESGGVFPKTRSRIIPPPIPVTVDKTKIPNTSALCSIALKAPVMAKARVPKRSKNKIKISREPKIPVTPP